LKPVKFFKQGKQPFEMENSQCPFKRTFARRFYSLFYLKTVKDSRFFHFTIQILSNIVRKEFFIVLRWCLEGHTSVFFQNWGNKLEKILISLIKPNYYYFLNFFLECSALWVSKNSHSAMLCKLIEPQKTITFLIQNLTGRVLQAPFLMTLLLF